MNHMKEVAKMLGVELGEKFNIIQPNTKIASPIYYFDLEGLKCDETGDWLCGLLLNHLLSGEYTIKRLPWKPSYNEQYYSIGQGGALEPGTWMNDYIDLAFYKLGNCYRTVQEAEANRDKWIDFYSTNKVLE